MSKKASPEKWIVWGIPVLFIIGSLFHFIYDFTNEFFPIGLIAPVNESVWEHMKLFPFPIFIWWIIYYIRRKDNIHFNKEKWLGGMLSAIVSSMILIPLLFYTYKGITGKQLLWVDILVALIAIAGGQLLGLHIYKHGNGIDKTLAFVLLLVILAIIIWFTVSPPEIPLFFDTESKTYGIFKRT